MKLLSVFVVLMLSQQSLRAALPDQVRQLVGHGGPVNAVAVNQAGTQALTGSLDYSVILWDLTPPKPKLLHRFQAHRGAVTALHWVPDSPNLAVSAADDGDIILWDTTEQLALHHFSGHRAKIVSIAFTPDGKRMASASWDGKLRVWDLPNRALLQTISVHKETLHAALLSSDGTLAYSAGHDGRIREWAIDSGHQIRELHSHGWPVNLMQWLPGQQKIVFGTANGDVQIVDLASRKIDKILIPHAKPVLGLAVAEQAGLLATGGNDGAIRVWKLEDWSLVGETHGIPGPVWSLAFADDDSALFFGTLDDAARYWQISDMDDIDWAHNRSKRRFQVKSGLPLGELQFARKCSVCHDLKPELTNRAGPSLYQIMGRKAGTRPGYAYSDALRDSELVWNRETIERLFVDGPHVVVPGSKMPLQKIPNDANRAALIEYLAGQ